MESEDRMIQVVKCADCKEVFGYWSELDRHTKTHKKVLIGQASWKEYEAQKQKERG